MHRTPLCVPLVAVLAAGCSADSVDVPAIAVRDSAGIRVVENSVALEAVPVYAELGPEELQIGVVDGDPAYSFTTIDDVRTLPDGDIIVVEGQALELRVYDGANGEHVRTIGRRGEGPGEFGRLARLAGVRGDTVWAWDNRLSRLTWFGTDGQRRGDMRVEVGQYLTAELTRLGDGTHLAALADFSAANDAERFYVAPEPLMLLDAEGEPLDSLRNVGGLDMMVSRGTSDRGAQFVMIMPVPMGRGSSYATGVDRIYTGWNRAYRIVARSLAGDPLMVILAPGLERRIEPGEVEALRARRLDDCPTEECERDVRAMFDDVELPELRPAFSSLKVDELENLWVAEYEPNYDPPPGWHVFSPDGELLGRVAVPAGLEVHEIGADYVLGVQDNELDVPFVRRYRVTRLR